MNVSPAYTGTLLACTSELTIEPAISAGTNPYLTMKQPSGPAAPPVAGSSVMPGGGTSRLYAVAPSSPGSVVNA